MKVRKVVPADKFNFSRGQFRASFVQPALHIIALSAIKKPFVVTRLSFPRLPSESDRRRHARSPRSLSNASRNFSPRQFSASWAISIASAPESSSRLVTSKRAVTNVCKTARSASGNSLNGRRKLRIRLTLLARHAHEPTECAQGQPLARLPATMHPHRRAG